MLFLTVAYQNHIYYRSLWCFSGDELVHNLKNVISFDCIYGFDRLLWNINARGRGIFTYLFYHTITYIKIHITQNLPGTDFWLWCLQPDHNEILHESGPLDPNYRKTTLYIHTSHTSYTTKACERSGIMVTGVWTAWRLGPSASHRGEPDGRHQVESLSLFLSAAGAALYV